MKMSKKIIAVLTVVGVLATTGAVMAATGKTPAEIVSGLTGQTTAELYQQRAAGKTFGTIAKEAGQLEQFKSAMQEQKKAILDQRVAEGTITQAQADAAFQAIQENIASCDGSGSMAIGKKNGVGFGQGGMMGGQRGAGAGQGRGFGRMGFGR